MTRSHTLRRVLAGIGSVTLLGLISACGSVPGESGGKTTLTLLEKWPEPQYQQFWKDIERDYEKEHPDVDLQIEAVGDQPIKEKLQVLASSGQLPEIYFSWAGDFTKKFVRAGLAHDLTEHLDGTEWGDRLAPAAVDAFTYDDKVYGVPIDLDGKFFVYNTDLFDEHGISVPTTFEELLTSCDQLREAGVQPIGFGNQFGWPAVHYLTTLNARFVPAEMRAADYVPETAQWTHPGYEAALDAFNQLRDRCFPDAANGIPHENAVAQVQNGKAAMVYVQSLEFELFTAEGGAPETIVDNWDFFGFPPVDRAEGEQDSLTGAPDGFLVNAKSEHTDLAVEFLDWFTSKTNGEKLVAGMGRLSSVEGSASDENTFPQLREALPAIEQASAFDIWLDTVTHADVASAYLSGGEALLGGSSAPSDVMASVKEASEAAKAG